MQEKQAIFMNAIMYIALLIASVVSTISNPNYWMIIITCSIVFIVIQSFQLSIFGMQQMCFFEKVLSIVKWVPAFIIQAIDGSFLPQVFFFVLIVEAAFHTSKSFSIPYAIFCYGGFVAGVSINSGELPFFVIPRALEYALIWGFSYTAKTAINQKQLLEQAYDELQKKDEELSEKTILKDRMQISKRIHDTVSHTLTTASFGVETGKQLLLGGKKDDAAAQLERTREQINQSLHKLRESVHTLYQINSFKDFKGSLVELIEDTISQAGIMIEYDLSELSKLAPEQEVVFYRALQEGLANGLKHGNSTEFEFKMFADDEEVHFDLLDNGTFSEPIAFGFGMKAMDKRVKQIGGIVKLQKRSDAPGAHLHIRCPLQMKKSEVGEEFLV